MMAVRSLIRCHEICTNCRVFFFSSNSIKNESKAGRKPMHNTNSRLMFYSTQENENNLSHDGQSEVGYTVSKEDFKWAKRLLPPSKIPDPPKHAKYPTPSGWSPPSDPPPDLPYFIPRDRFHELNVIVNENASSGSFTHITNVEGDMWALNEDLAKFLEPELKYDLATTVHEVSQKLTIKGKFRDQVLKFLELQGF